MIVKLRTRPSTLQKLLGKENEIGEVEFIVEGADNPTVRALRPLVPVDKEHIEAFNPLVGSLQFSAKANKRLLEFLEKARQYIPDDELPENYQRVVDYLSQKYH